VFYSFLVLLGIAVIIIGSLKVVNGFLYSGLLLIFSLLFVTGFGCGAAFISFSLS
jgi:hypothetical protein